MLNFGAIPDGLVIDHIDRDPSNNDISNLRLVTQAVNLRNTGTRRHNRAGEKYINMDKRTGKFTVRISRKTYGTYPELSEAVRVRDEVLSYGVV